MADLLDFLPLIGKTPLFGPSITQTTNDRPQTPPMFGAAPEHMTLGGVPLSQLLGGLALGGIAASLAPKYRRGRALGSGFMIGQNLFGRPIEEEKANYNQMMAAIVPSLINKGVWSFLQPSSAETATNIPAAPVTPSASGVLPTSFQAETPETSLLNTEPPGTFSQAPPAAQLAQLAQPAARPAAYVAGLPVYTAPTTTLGKVFAGRTLSPEVANMPIPITPEVAATMGQMGEQKKLEDFFASQGIVPGTPAPIAAQEFKEKRMMDLLKQYQGEGGGKGTTSTQVEFTPNGPRFVSKTMAPDIFALRKSENEARTLAAQRAANAAERAANFTQARIDALQSQAPIKAIGKQIDAVRDDQRTLTAQLSAINAEERANPMMDPQARTALGEQRRMIQQQLGENHDYYQQLKDDLAKAQGKSPAEKPAPIDPAKQAFFDRTNKALEGFKQFSSIEKVDQLPLLKDQDQQDIQATAQYQLHKMVDPIMGMMNQYARQGLFGKSLTQEQIAYIRSIFSDIPDEYFNMALRSWKNYSTSQTPAQLSPQEQANSQVTSPFALP